MNDLYIEWETGHMNIHMDFFFPCNIQRFKKLLKIIKLDWQHEEELKEKLKATSKQNFRIGGFMERKQPQIL